MEAESLPPKGGGLRPGIWTLKLENRDKWVILELFHVVELLLKERLQREHPLLIYRNIDKKVSDDAQTVGLKDALLLFANTGIDIPKEYIKILFDLQQRRNRIEHHRFEADESHQRVLGQVLKFIGWFLYEHLDEDLEEHLSPDVFKVAKTLMVAGLD